MQWFQYERSDWNVTDFLLLKFTINLLETIIGFVQILQTIEKVTMIFQILIVNGQNCHIFHNYVSDSIRFDGTTIFPQQQTVLQISQKCVVLRNHRFNELK